MSHHCLQSAAATCKMAQVATPSRPREESGIAFSHQRFNIGGGSKVVEEECVDADSGPSNIRQAQNIEVEAQGGGVDMEAQMQGLVDVHLNVEEVLQNVGDGDNSKEENDTDDPNYEADSDLHFSDSEDDYCGDDGLFDLDITLGEMHQDIRKSKKSKSAVEKLKKTQKAAIEKKKSSHLSDDEGLNSDELYEVSSKDDEADKKKFSVQKELKDMSNYKWEARTLYATREEFKENVTSYAVHIGRNIKFSVVDNVRVRAKCGDGCEWFAYTVKMANKDSWQLRTVNNHHSCNTVFDIKVMKSKWLAKIFRKKVEENPKLKLGTIQSMTLRKWNVQISRTKVFWAKQDLLVQCIRGLGWPILQQGLIPNQKDTKNFNHQDQLECLGATQLQVYKDNPHHKGVRLSVLSQGLNCVTSCVWCFF
ncbi:hypothetical protein Ahy_A08g039358 [Arachis hypogaea]|uniref:Transposase MuDR plant domain-containing protein n=1 Tax=Arachis hypogaea TaxID=3818 RepID=A0A445BW95_ARAHY|nr:hypothetical protein Ahy_A08g039358 [Arachis hypogaea]